MFGPFSSVAQYFVIMIMTGDCNHWILRQTACYTNNVSKAGGHEALLIGNQ